MTDKIPPLSTQSATSKQAAHQLDKPSKDTYHNHEVKKDDDYNTIKCICKDPRDDGSTIFCETCKTWQHIYCYYLGREAEALEDDFDHSCADCKPRELDRQKAVERQRLRLGLPPDGGDSHDKKARRPSSKSHKKKSKPTDLQLNGYSGGVESSKHGNPHEHPPAKKSKTSHKSSQSVSTLAPKRSPSHGTPKVSNPSHPLSPATTPPDLPCVDFEFNSFNPHLLKRYDDSDVQIVDINTYANLKTSDRMSLWLKDEDIFWQDTQREFKQVVKTSTPLPLQHQIHVESKDRPLANGTVLRWQSLATPSPIEKEVPMMELNGLVGLQKDYCNNPENRWGELCLPVPFVFFPHSVPLYIDTRKEGSNARYVRRSCRPNARLDTIILNDSEYHFWLVSDKPIDADEQITLPWEISFPADKKDRTLRLLDLDPKEANAYHVEDIDEAEYCMLSQWIQRILMEYGGCACEPVDECAFVRFFRNYSDKFQPLRSMPQKKKRAKSKHTISPTSTGQATNSRAASEGRTDEAPEHDEQAVAYPPSKPPSRDRTPARHGSFDTLGILTEPTNRDKRKVQIVENLFQKSAQEQQGPPRKKKKTTADGAANPAASKSKNRSAAGVMSEKQNGSEERRYIDAGTSGMQAGSPTSVTSQSPVRSVKHPSRQCSVVSEARSSSSTSRNYSDAAVQTEPVGAKLPFEHASKSRPQKRVMSLAMKLMNQRRLDLQAAQQRPASAMELDSPATTKSPQGSPASVHRQMPVSSPASTDTNMPDAPPAAADASSANLPPNNDMEVVTGLVKANSPELRVQMPPVPASTSPTSATATTTPISTNGSVVQSPLSTLHIPTSVAASSSSSIAATSSPVKKKMSLSEYKNKANRAAASARPSVDYTHPLKTFESVAEASKSLTNGIEEAKDGQEAMAEQDVNNVTAAP